LVSSYKAAYQFFCNPTEVVVEGYIKNRDGVFRVPRPWRWDYIANGPQRTREIAGAPDDVLSLQQGVDEVGISSLALV
jgi:hypothetical protein